MKAKKRALDAAPAGAVLAVLLYFATGFVKPLPAGEPVSQAAEVVRSLAAEIWSIRDQSGNAGARQRQLALAIQTSTDVDLLSRLSLGRYWRSLSVSDRDEYQSLFAESIIGGLASRLDSLASRFDGPLDQHFSITASRPAGKKDILIRSKVIGVDANPLSVDWRLRNLENGPVIIDLVIEGVSLLVSQRAEFASVIERAGIGGLIDILRSRVRNGDL